MDAELDYDLTLEQWEALKALRVPAQERRRVSAALLAQLVALGLAAASDEMPAMTGRGRKVLIRGSARLWDVAA
jgi:hypothetical protein